MFKANLIRCGYCKLNSVVPIMDECHEQPDRRWILTIRCTACFDTRVVDVAQQVADEFDTALDAEAREVLALIRKRELSDFRTYVKRFTSALKADAVLPEDFR
jgi:predicted adenine nucleotide alpha hydrolase (AANH) superfamily ATPase